MPAGSAIPETRTDGKVEDDDLEARGDNVDWGEMHQNFDRDDDDTTATGDKPETEEEVLEEEEEKRPPAPAPGERKPAPVEQPPKGEEPGEKPQGEKPPEGEKPETGEQPKPETPEQKQERERREAEERQQYEQKLTEYYKIPEDLAARLATEPEQVLPVLATKVHMAVEAGMRNFIAEQLPRYMQHYQRVQEAETQTRSAFYERWPGLSKYEAQVKQVGAMFRQLNPKASREDALDKIGRLTYAALGLEVPAAGNRPPAARPRSNGQQPRRPARPAGTHSSQAGAPPPSENIFTDYAEQMLEEDQRGGES